MHVVAKLIWPFLHLMDLKDTKVFLSPIGPLPDAILQVQLHQRCLENYFLSYLTVDRDPLGARLWHNLRLVEGLKAETSLVIRDQDELALQPVLDICVWFAND